MFGTRIGGSFFALSLALSALSAVSTLAACAAEPVADDEATDDALKVKPKDTDPTVEAKLTVVAPSGADMDKVEKRPLVATGHSMTGALVTLPVEYGTPIVLRPGAWKVCFAKTTYPPPKNDGLPVKPVLVPTTECTTVTMVKGQPSSVALSAVRVKVSGPPLAAAAPVPDFGPFAGVPHWAHLEPTIDGTECAYDGGLVVLPGAHRVLMRKYANDAIPFDQTVNVAAGEIATLAPTTTSLPQPKPIKLRVSFETPELPTVNGWTTYTVTGVVADDPTTKWNGVFQAGFASRPSGAGAVSLTGLVCPTCSATFKNVTNGITMPFGMTGDVDLALKRLDVDDVEVTPTDGSPVYTVTGQWTVQKTGTTIVYGPFDTGYGLDLPPGGYELVIKYNTQKKYGQTQTSHVDL